MSRLVVDVGVVWGDGPATSPVPGGEAVVRVEKTDPFRPFYAVGWLQPRTRPKARVTLELVGEASERERNEGWADWLALAYVVGRAQLDGLCPLEALEKAKVGLPVASRARVRRVAEARDEEQDLADELFGGGSSETEQLDLFGSGS